MSGFAVTDCVEAGLDGCTNRGGLHLALALAVCRVKVLIPSLLAALYQVLGLGLGAFC